MTTTAELSTSTLSTIPITSEFAGVSAFAFIYFLVLRFKTLSLGSVAWFSTLDCLLS